MKYNNILETIGNTPLVRINKLSPNPNTTIYAKIESHNPSGSIKDRIAIEMIHQAELSGELTKDKTIIEPTSGNTGIGLAMIGAVKGYDVKIVMSKNVSEERQKMIKAFGATIILTPPELGTDGAIIKAKELVNDNPEKYFMPDQFSNKHNVLIHYKTTGKEIWQQTDGKINYFVSSIGTSGTMMGTGKALKEFNPKIKLIAAQPTIDHQIQGLKNMEGAIVPKIYNQSKIDETIMVNTDDAYQMAHRVIKEEGIFVGMSSGAAMRVAVEVAKKIKSGTIVVILPDGGEKYLSTKLFE